MNFVSGNTCRYYAKRCLVALLEALAKNMMMIKDETFHEILQFLDQVRQRWAANKVSTY